MLLLVLFILLFWKNLENNHIHHKIIYKFIYFFEHFYIFYTFIVNLFDFLYFYSIDSQQLIFYDFRKFY